MTTEINTAIWSQVSFTNFYYKSLFVLAAQFIFDELRSKLYIVKNIL
jgi:hypothetical protein